MKWLYDLLDDLIETLGCVYFVSNALNPIMWAVLYFVGPVEPDGDAFMEWASKRYGQNAFTFVECLATEYGKIDEITLHARKLEVPIKFPDELISSDWERV